MKEAHFLNYISHRFNMMPASQTSFCQFVFGSTNWTWLELSHTQQGQFHGRATCAAAQGPTLRRASFNARSAVVILKVLTIFEQGARGFIWCWALQMMSMVLFARHGPAPPLYLANPSGFDVSFYIPCTGRPHQLHHF